MPRPPENRHREVTPPNAQRHDGHARLPRDPQEPHAAPEVDPVRFPNRPHRLVIAPREDEQWHAAPQGICRALIGRWHRTDTSEDDGSGEDPKPEGVRESGQGRIGAGLIDPERHDRADLRERDGCRVIRDEEKRPLRRQVLEAVQGRPVECSDQRAQRAPDPPKARRADSTGVLHGRSLPAGGRGHETSSERFGTLTQSTRWPPTADTCRGVNDRRRR